MGWLALIRLALESIVALPKIWDRFLTSDINARLNRLEAKHAAVEAAYELAKNAKTNEEKLNAADSMFSAWASRK